MIESRDKTKDEDIGSSGDAVRVSVLVCFITIKIFFVLIPIFASIFSIR